MAELGRAALILTLGLSLYALVAGGAAAALGRRRLAASARNALLASFVSTLVAALVLVAGFVRDDFSLAYVAGHSSRALPLQYKISAFWGGQEGSLLLWLLVLTGYAALAVWFARKRTRPRRLGDARARRDRGRVQLAARRRVQPVRHDPRPADGAASTQPPEPVHGAAPRVPLPRVRGAGGAVRVRHGRAALGADGRAVDRGDAALDDRRVDGARIGQLLGAHWAYQEVGWGGYYAWDPVENAALMPWLAATAFLHSVMIQEKRGMLRVWNVTLVSLAFCLSLFGTFLTRSGVVSSIHSFTQSAIGPWFLGLIVVAVTFATAMIWLRLPLLRTTARLESLVSREATFLYNNLLLVALCLTILWGTAWPIVSRGGARGGRRRRPAVLRLLPAGLRAAAAPADGHRPARRLAARLAARARAGRWPAGIALATGRS